MAAGTKEDPWELKTPPGTSSYTMYKDEQADPPTLVCQVGSTTLKYRLRAVEDLHAWLKAQGDWVPLGAADEKKPAADGSACTCRRCWRNSAWPRSATTPATTGCGRSSRSLPRSRGPAGPGRAPYPRRCPAR